MSFHRPSLFIFLLLFDFQTEAGGQAVHDVQPGVQYVGETTLSFPDYGISLLLPEGWAAVLPPQSEFLVISGQQYEAFILTGIQEATIPEARQVMSEPMDVGDGVVFRPDGEVLVDGNVLTGDYSVSGARNPLVGHVMTIVDDNGQAGIFIAGTVPDNLERLKSVVAEISASISVSEPRATSAGSSSGRSGPWAEELIDRKLSYFYTRTGYTEERYIWLCSSGRFYYSSQSGGFGGGASGAFASENAGSWGVSGAFNSGALALNYNDGSTATYELTHEGTNLFLDGKRYFRETTNCH